MLKIANALTREFKDIFNQDLEAKLISELNDNLKKKFYDESGKLIDTDNDEKVNKITSHEMQKDEKKKISELDPNFSGEDMGLALKDFIHSYNEYQIGEYKSLAINPFQLNVHRQKVFNLINDEYKGKILDKKVFDFLNKELNNLSKWYLNDYCQEFTDNNNRLHNAYLLKDMTKTISESLTNSNVKEDLVEAKNLTLHLAKHLHNFYDLETKRFTIV